MKQPHTRIIVATLAPLLVACSVLAQQSTNANKNTVSTSASPKSMQPINQSASVASANATVAQASTQATTSAAIALAQAAEKNPTAIKAKVIEVKGVVETVPVGTDPLDADAWKPLKEGDTIGNDVMIRTGLRSRCVLMFGEEPNQTVISVRRATLARISEFVRTSTEQRIKLGLGYGAIRGGSSEGTLRSDVVIDSTVATLAKRGTEGFELEIEPTTGRFRISLSRSGLVDALSRLNNQRRTVAPGQYATSDNIAKMWVNQDIFDRCVRFYEQEALSEQDLEFVAKETTGLSNLGPAGRGLFNASGRNIGAILNIVRNRNPNLFNNPTLVLGSSGISRPEGGFGFGQTFRVLTPRFERRTAASSTRNVRPRRIGLTPRRPARLIRHRSSATR